MEEKLAALAQPIGELNFQEGRGVKVAGIITAISKITTRSREPMVFATLEDTSAKTEVLVFPKVLKKDLFVWRTDNIVLVEGRTNTKDGALKIIAERVSEIALDPTDSSPKQLTLTLAAGSKKNILIEIKAVLEKYPGETPVILKIPQNSDFKTIKTKIKVEKTADLLHELKALLGVKNVD